MENYSYAESGESSPRSRDVDFDHLLPLEDQLTTNNYKVKFMCSYGGKIHPRPHDNQLSYVGGETKILAVDRLVKFAVLMAKLTALCDGEVCFKYQLPGEDLDALISVTNDDDLEHMMHEYDRLNRASASPARLRLFLFPVSGQSPALTPVQSFGSTEEKSERERFMDAFNSGHLQTATPPSATPLHGNMELMFGSDKGMLPQPSEMGSRNRDHHMAIPQILPQGHEIPVVDERAIEADRIQKHIEDLQRLRIAEDQQPALYRKPSDDNLAAGYHYVPKMNEKIAPTTLPGTVTTPATGYQISGGLTASTILSDQPQVYMIPAPASMYHAPMARPVTAPVNHAHGYYVQRMPTEVYRDQPVYNVTPQQADPVGTPQITQSAQQHVLPQKVATYTEGYRMVQSTTAVTDSGYAQVAYDNGTGRHIYYTPQGAVVAPSQQSQQPLQSTAQQYQAMAVTAPVTLNQESAGKVVPANMKEFI